MAWRKFFVFPLSVLIPLLVTGCTYPISRELRDEARVDLTFPTVLKNPDAYVGSIVIWGGRIIEVQNRAGETEIMVLESPLGYEEMPKAAEYSRGRFIVKTRIFLDPAIYKPGRKITVAGEIAGKEIRPLGETKYAYPVLRAREIHLWRKEIVYTYPPGYWWGPGWGRGWYGPYWYDDYWEY